MSRTLRVVDAERALPIKGETRGDIRFDGANCDAAAIEHRAARGMTRVPEKRELLGKMSVEDNLLLGGKR